MGIVFLGATLATQKSKVKTSVALSATQTPEIVQPAPAESPAAETIPTFVFGDLKVNVEDSDQVRRLSISDPGAGCAIPAAEEIPYPDETALRTLIDQLAKAINERDKELYNELFANEEDHIDFMPVMPDIQEYTLHYYGDGLVVADLTWLDCDQTLHSQYRITLDESDGLKIKTLKEKPDCANRATVSLADPTELAEGLMVALRKADYYEILAYFPRTTPCSETGFDLWEGVNVHSVEAVETSLAGTWSAVLIEMDVENPAHVTCPGEASLLPDYKENRSELCLGRVLSNSG